MAKYRSLFRPSTSSWCVWSEWSRPVVSCMLIHNSGVVCACVDSDWNFSFWDLILERVASKWPIAVNTDGTKFFRTDSTVRPSIAIFLFFIFRINDVLDGYPNAACQYATYFLLLLTSTAGEVVGVSCVKSAKLLGRLLCQRRVAWLIYIAPSADGHVASRRRMR